MSQGCALYILRSKGQRSRSQCINYWIWFLAHNSFPLYTYHLSSWNFTCRLPMRQGCALYILRSKGQRSRSQCINYWKWFPAHNCFPFTPIIMKLHMQTPYEARMCPIDFEVKRSKVKVTMHKLLKNGFRRITSFPLHLSSWNFTCRLPMSQGCAL